MPHHRLLPLLIVGAACFPLAACGDDEPASTATDANVPAETTPAEAGGASASADTSATTATPPADDDTGAPDADAPADDAPSGADDAAPKRGDGSSSSSGSSASKSSPAGGSKQGSSKPSSGGGAKGKQPEAPQIPKVLEEYAKGGAPATADEAASVRKTMLEFQAALAAEDAGKACSYTLGLPAKSDPSKPSLSCESLIEGSRQAPPTDEDRAMINAAKITVNGDRASIEMGEAGMPMPFRHVDGRWRIDYGTLLGMGGATG